MTNKSIPKEFPKNSQRIPKEFQKNSRRIPEEFQKNSQEFPKNSQKIPKKIPKFGKYPIPYIALRGRKPFQACYLSFASITYSTMVWIQVLPIQLKISSSINRICFIVWGEWENLVEKPRFFSKGQKISKNNFFLPTFFPKNERSFLPNSALRV